MWDGSGSQQHTPQAALHSDTHPHLLCGRCGEVSSLVVLPQQHHSAARSALMWDHSSRGRKSQWHRVGNRFTEHTCWRNKHRGHRNISSPKPHVFTAQSLALSTFSKSKPPNSTRMSQTPACQPQRTSQEGKFHWLLCFCQSFFLFSTKDNAQTKLALANHKQILMGKEKHKTNIYFHG